MILRSKHIKLSVVTTLVVTMFFSCQADFKEVQKIGVLQNQPIGEAKNINLKYTETEDSLGRVIANLESPKMLDYSNRDFSFSEFPDGIRLTLFDEDNQKNVVLADYAVVYNATDLIDLQGNVILVTPQNDSLFAAQMYYDQNREWLFTNSPVQLRSISGRSGYGDIFDADTKFNNYTILEGRGEGILED